MKDFTGKKLLVIGGTSGIGKMAAQRVLERGGSALVVGRRPERVAAAVKELGRLGVVAGERADLTSMTEMEQLRIGIDAHHGDTDYLVNAPGMPSEGILPQR